MILREQLVEIGVFNKPHGISGEINVSLDADIDLSSLKCIVMDMDGIYVPFFVSSVRSRGAMTVLVMIDGVNNEAEAAALTGKTVYALESDVDIDVEDVDGDGLYADDMIGFKIRSVDGLLDGTVTDVDDSTDNVLFIVEAAGGKTVYIPVAEEFIEDVDVDDRMVTVDLPDGLLDI